MTHLTFASFCGVHSEVILFTHSESIIRSQSIDLHFRRVTTRFNLDSKRTPWNSLATVLDVNTVAAWFLRYIFDSVSSISILLYIYRQIRATRRRYTCCKEKEMRVLNFLFLQFRGTANLELQDKHF